jgi:hypothetical protein
MKKFIGQLMLFLLPLTIIPIFNYQIDSKYLLSHFEELDQVAKTLLSGKKVSIPPNFANFNQRYLQKIMIKKMKRVPEIILLGTSTTMELKASYLGLPPKLFSNHSMPVGGLKDYIGLLGCYKKRGVLPKKIIISLSPSLFDDSFQIRVFTKRWETLSNEYYYMRGLIEDDQPKFSFNLKAKFIIKYLENLLSLKYALSNFKTVKKGVDKNGADRVEEDILLDIDTDGSFSNLLAKNADTYTLDKVQKRVKKFKKKRPVFCNNALFLSLVDYLLINGSQVIFYLSPYHPLLYADITTLANHRGFHNKVRNLVDDVARSRNIPVYGSYDPQSFDFQTRDFFDATHIHDFAIKKILKDFNHNINQHKIVGRGT